jgi:hypothetical protein
MPGFGIKDIADSGSEVDKKTNVSAPKKKNCKVLPPCSFKDFTNEQNTFFIVSNF